MSRSRLRYCLMASCLVVLVFTGGPASGSFESVSPKRSIRSVDAETIEKIRLMHDRAENQILTGDFQGALETYWNIIFFEPDDETAYTGMGQVYLVLGNYRKAH